MVHCLAFPILLAALPMLRASASGETAPTVGSPVSKTFTASEQPTAESDCCEHGLCPATTFQHNDCDLGCCLTPTDFRIHAGLLDAVAPLGFVAWVGGYRKHPQTSVLMLGSIGVLLLCGALLLGHQLFGRREQVMTVAGSICMVTAHLWNRRQCKCCRDFNDSSLVEEDVEAEGVQSTAALDGGI